MAIEQNFKTPASINILTTANVVGNTVTIDLQPNVARAQTYPAFSQNFIMNPRLDARFRFNRNSNATYVAANGMIAYANNTTARFEYDPVSGNCRGLLMEGARTNYVPTSIGANTSNWSGYGIDGSGIINTAYDIVANAAISPDGTNNASFLYWKTYNPNYSWYVTYPLQWSNLPTNTTFSQSIFIKPGPVADPAFYLGHYDSTDSGENIQVYYYPANNTITGTSYSANAIITTPPAMQDYPNGWKRIFFSFKYIGGSSHDIQFKHSLAGPVTANTVGRQGFYIWGPQVEQGPNPSSFIPTYGVTARREADYAEITDISAFKGTTMTVVSKSAPLAYTSNTQIDNDYNIVWGLATKAGEPNGAHNFVWQRWLPHSSPYNATYYIQETYYANTANPDYSGYIGFGLQITFPMGYNQPISNATYYTSATVCQPNGFIYAVGNSGITGDANIPFSANVDQLTIGCDLNGYSMNGYIGSIAIWPSKLSNTEIINITALSA